MKMETRTLLCLCVALMCNPLPAIAAESSKPGIGPDFQGPLGLQLYSLRNQFAKDVPGTLDLVKKFGFRYAELAGTYDQPPAKFLEAVENRGIKAIAGHFPYERYQKDPEGVAKEAKELGLMYAGCAWIPHDKGFDEAKCREAIAVFNKAGEVLAKSKIKFFYHQHGYEFASHGTGTLMDLMMAETKPEFVRYEMDIFWVVFPAQDPVALLNKYGKRWELMHLKDLKKGVKTGSLSGGTDVANDVALGTGQMDMPAILKAAKKAGVRWYFIEDESPSSVEQIPQSLRFLEQVRF
jgi:sugar phosphate isomerase/epimerase